MPASTAALLLHIDLDDWIPEGVSNRLEPGIARHSGNRPVPLEAKPAGRWRNVRYRQTAY
ncbi:MAG: hypothetical protein WBO06_13440 [Gammaproteobacteria bacterium]